VETKARIHDQLSSASNLCSLVLCFGSLGHFNVDSKPCDYLSFVIPPLHNACSSNQLLCHMKFFIECMNNNGVMSSS